MAIEPYSIDPEDDLDVNELDQLMDAVTVISELGLTKSWSDDDNEYLDSAFQKLMNQYSRKVKIA